MTLTSTRGQRTENMYIHLGLNVSRNLKLMHNAIIIF